jgi:glycosyltransferase involved in cell wall biosynthesis
VKLVSVISPVLNGDEYIEECILSVLNQSYQNTEHIFADGGSTDNTLSILKDFNNRYPSRVKYFSTNGSSGSQSANDAIIASKGDIIGFLGADDSYTPNAIQNVVDLFSHVYFEDVYFIYGSCNYIKDNKIVKIVIAREPKEDELITGRFYIYGPSMFYRRELFEEIGYFDTNPRYAAAGDLDLLIRISKQYDMHYTTNVLSNWRIRPWLLNGKSWERTLKVLKSSYFITSDYGGKCTWSARMYFLACAIEFLRPILQPAYNLIDRYITNDNRLIAR